VRNYWPGFLLSLTKQKTRNKNKMRKLILVFSIFAFTNCTAKFNVKESKIQKRNCDMEFVQQESHLLSDTLPTDERIIIKPYGIPGRLLTVKFMYDMSPHDSLLKKSDRIIDSLFRQENKK
jgi:hypothetical protein